MISWNDFLFNDVFYDFRIRMMVLLSVDFCTFSTAFCGGYSFQSIPHRPPLDIYLNLLNAFARSANSAKVSASPLTFTGIPVSAIAFSISSFEKSSYIRQPHNH